MPTNLKLNRIENFGEIMLAVVALMIPAVTFAVFLTV